MKNWILNTFFSKDLAEAKRQGGIEAFPLAQKDILETMRDDLDNEAEILAQEKLNDLLSLVDFNKIVRLDKERGIVYIGDKRAEEGRLKNLKAEAEFFTSSDLWYLIATTPRELAQRAMFVDGESLDNMKKGRSMLYTLKSQENILDTFKSYVTK